MAEQHSTKSPSLSPPSQELLDSANNLDTFPPLTETPAAMSPVPGYAPTSGAEPASTHTLSDAEDDSSWSTETDEEQDAGQRGSNSQDNNSRNLLYEAIFGRSSRPRPTERGDELSIYKSSLLPRDVESCVLLEDICFPGATIDESKVRYRIAKGSGLNIGLFTTVRPADELSNLATYATASEVETGSDRRSVLVAFLQATLTDNGSVTVDDDHIPPDWRSSLPQAAPHLGHKPFGETVAVHSFGVIPELRGKGLGNTLVKSYIHMIKTAKVYRSISVSVPSQMVSWFERYDFELVGSSQLDSNDGAERADMTIVFNETDSDEDE